MDTNEKLNRLIRKEKLKQFRIWGGALTALIVAVILVFHYRYNENWTNEIVSGTVNKVVIHPSDGATHFVIEVDIGGNVVFVSEFYPPGIKSGDHVQVRVTSNEDGTKNKYFRLR